MKIIIVIIHTLTTYFQPKKKEKEKEHTLNIYLISLKQSPINSALIIQPTLLVMTLVYLIYSHNELYLRVYRLCSPITCVVTITTVKTWRKLNMVWFRFKLELSRTRTSGGSSQVDQHFHYHHLITWIF